MRIPGADSRHLPGPRSALGVALIAAALALGACSNQANPTSIPSPRSSTPSMATTGPTPGTTAPSATRATPTLTGQGEAALESALETATEQAIRTSLAEAGITVSSGPDCNADLTMDRQARSASGNETCTGKTSDGLTVKGTFTGSITSTGSCDGTLVVKVAGKTVLSESLTTCTVS